MNLYCEIIFCLIICIHHTFATQFTFDLPDRVQQCFYEILTKNVKSALEFQVTTGGNYDVDVTFTSPSKKELYNKKKKQYDSMDIVPTESGVYKICFSNEFSTFTDKTIFFEWKAVQPEYQEDKDVPPNELTLVETSSRNIFQTLSSLSTYQTHNRLRESTTRAFAGDLNKRVLYWSLGQSFIIILIGIGQVMVLKSFFSERKYTGYGFGIST